jgi:cell division protein FtsQ
MSTAATLKRGRQPARRAPARKKASLFVRMIAALPLSDRTWQRLAMATVLGTGLAIIIIIATMLDLPRQAGLQAAHMIGNSGFAVKRVEVTGIDRMERLTVYAIALDQESRAMPLVDLNEVRDRLMQYGWIADARVSRRLPDTLVVDIVERKPAAVWQYNQQLSLIDAHGIVLEPVAPNAMPNLPLVIGPDANVQATALSELMDHAPRLRSLLVGAIWVGNRRWDLRFQTGEVLALPEGEKIAAGALIKFTQLDANERLLGRGFMRFDMRDPAKMFVRIGRGKPAIDAPQADVTTENGADENAPEAKTRTDAEGKTAAPASTPKPIIGEVA